MKQIIVLRSVVVRSASDPRDSASVVELDECESGVVAPRLRCRVEISRARPFRIPFGPVLIPGLGVVTCAGLALYLPPTSWLRFVAWLAIGLVIYFSYGFRRSRLQRAHAAAS